MLFVEVNSTHYIYIYVYSLNNAKATDRYKLDNLALRNRLCMPTVTVRGIILYIS